VFNTAELIINQLGLTPGVNGGLELLLNHYVEDVQNPWDGSSSGTGSTTTSSNASGPASIGRSGPPPG
ncbi:MAG TPA: hypothetical protein VLT84_12110, partial [Acidobacteriota bacterium]|nr:hypothetical protein [Acidobacteriota bacterium]